MGTHETLIPAAAGARPPVPRPTSPRPRVPSSHVPTSPRALSAPQLLCFSAVPLKNADFPLTSHCFGQKEKPFRDKCPLRKGRTAAGPGRCRGDSRSRYSQLPQICRHTLVFPAARRRPSFRDVRPALPGVTRPGQTASPEKGMGKTSGLQHRKPGWWCPTPPPPPEMVIGLFSWGIWRRGRTDR